MWIIITILLLIIAVVIRKKLGLFGMNLQKGFIDHYISEFDNGKKSKPETIAAIRPYISPKINIKGGASNISSIKLDAAPGFAEYLDILNTKGFDEFRKNGMNIALLISTAQILSKVMINTII